MSYRKEEEERGEPAIRGDCKCLSLGYGKKERPGIALGEYSFLLVSLLLLSLRPIAHGIFGLCKHGKARSRISQRLVVQFSRENIFQSSLSRMLFSLRKAAEFA